MDRRTQRTRRAIYESFSTLLGRKSYSRITIQEIIDGADIGRSTFYAHFSAKEDLLKEICTELFARHIFPSAPLPAAEGDSRQAQENLQQMLAHTLEHLAMEKKMIRSILASEVRGYFLTWFQAYIDEFTRRYILAGGKEDSLCVSEDFFRNHISSSFMGTVQWWFDHNNEPEADEVARQYIKMIAPILP